MDAYGLFADAARTNALKMVDQVLTAQAAPARGTAPRPPTCVLDWYMTECLAQGHVTGTGYPVPSSRRPDRRTQVTRKLIVQTFVTSTGSCRPRVGLGRTTTAGSPTVAGR